MNEYKIGTKFYARGKSRRECEVIDVWKTYCSKGELVKIRYVVAHEFCGQILVNRDVCGTTIAMGLYDS